MFHGVLSGWAMDALRLRKRGLDVPTARGSSRSFNSPGGDRTPMGEAWRLDDSLRHPAWRDARDRAA